MRPILDSEAYISIARNQGTLIAGSRYGIAVTGGGDSRDVRRFRDLRMQVVGDVTGWDLSLEASFNDADWFNVNDLETSVPAANIALGAYALPGFWGHLRLVTNGAPGALVQGNSGLGILDAQPFDVILGGYEVGAW